MRAQEVRRHGGIIVKNPMRCQEHRHGFLSGCISILVVYQFFPFSARGYRLCLSFLAVTPAEAASCRGFTVCAARPIAYAVGDGGRLLRSELPRGAQGGLLGLSDRCNGPLPELPMLCRAILGECHVHRFGGVLADFEGGAREDRLPFLSRLGAMLTQSGRRLYVPESFAVPEASVLVCTALSGGTLRERLSDAAARRGTQRVARSTVSAFAMDFVLPCRSGEGNAAHTGGAVRTARALRRGGPFPRSCARIISATPRRAGRILFSSTPPKRCDASSGSDVSAAWRPPFSCIPRSATSCRSCSTLSGHCRVLLLKLRKQLRGPPAAVRCGQHRLIRNAQSGASHGVQRVVHAVAVEAAEHEHRLAQRQTGIDLLRARAIRRARECRRPSARSPQAARPSPPFCAAQRSASATARSPRSQRPELCSFIVSTPFGTSIARPAQDSKCLYRRERIAQDELLSVRAGGNDLRFPLPARGKTCAGWGELSGGQTDRAQRETSL